MITRESLRGRVDNREAKEDWDGSPIDVVKGPLFGKIECAIDCPKKADIKVCLRGEILRSPWSGNESQRQDESGESGMPTWYQEGLKGSHDYLRK
jgi:hypothetical protein